MMPGEEIQNVAPKKRGRKPGSGMKMNAGESPLSPDNIGSGISMMMGAVAYFRPEVPEWDKSEEECTALVGEPAAELLKHASPTTQIAVAKAFFPVILGLGFCELLAGPIQAELELRKQKREQQLAQERENYGPLQIERFSEQKSNGKPARKTVDLYGKRNAGEGLVTESDERSRESSISLGGDAPIGGFPEENEI